ncbi:Hemolysin secretion protein D, chromosomal [compost metagenome]
MVSTFSDLKDNIKSWEEKYVFKSPFNGKIQFLKFWVNNHFVQAGEQVFTIVSEDSNIYGQVTLPNIGSGKVKVGQEVIIKLDDYPYMEYGLIKGKVREISLTTHTEKTDKGDLENYLVHVQLPNALTTNYAKVIDIKHEMKGTAEIIANDRRLIQRVFDNLRYLLNK